MLARALDAAEDETAARVARHLVSNDAAGGCEVSQLVLVVSFLGVKSRFYDVEHRMFGVPPRVLEIWRAIDTEQLWRTLDAVRGVPMVHLEPPDEPVWSANIAYSAYILVSAMQDVCNLNPALF
ncbi:MAG TPA: hypothetical protein VLD39_10605, partial [Gammaproteobacteria bacterium]|nr:hypothetical protein [Gammaproteobacteria bacterium]